MLSASAGMRRHGEQVFGGDWEPIIDRGTFYALAEALEDSKRRTVRRGIKRHLLTGIARCALCGQAMGTRVPKAGQSVRYACVNDPGRRGCGRVTVVARPVEDVVKRIVLRSPLLFQGASDEAPVSEAEVRRQQAQRADDQATLEQLARDHYSERLISRAEFLAARKPLQERIAAAERAIVQAALPRREVHPDPEQAWQGMDTEDRRTWITSCIENLTIRPAARPGTNRFDPTRISIVTRRGEALDVRQTPELGLYLQSSDGAVLDL